MADEAFEILQEIVKVPRKHLSWWNLAVMALSREFDLDAAEAAEILSECWHTTRISPTKPSQILKEVASVPHEHFTWWNLAVLAYAHDNDVDAITASENLSDCWMSHA